MKIKQDVSHVYIIHNKDINKSRVGETMNPKEYIKYIQENSGCNIELIHKTKPVYDYSRAMYHVNRRTNSQKDEWFSDKLNNIAIKELQRIEPSLKICKITAAYLKRKNASQISEKYNISRTGVIKYLASLGYNATRKKPGKKPTPPKPKKSKFLSPERIQQMILEQQEKNKKILAKKNAL